MHACSSINVKSVTLIYNTIACYFTHVHSYVWIFKKKKLSSALLFVIMYVYWLINCRKKNTKHAKLRIFLLYTQEIKKYISS